ncbi:MAG: PEP-CTERM sorting domain-containing protein [Microcystis aeruginosa G13-05]|nr:PEP-CTERM sorting domain-containing protein [Microcystis aeruginosa G13-05]
MKLSRLSTVKNLTRLALGGTLGATLIITASKPSEAAILGWDIRRDDPYGFDGSFYFDNGSVSATETFSVVIPGLPAVQAVTLTTAHVKAPHGEGYNGHPNVIFPRSLNSSGTEKFKHESHFNIRTYNYAPGQLTGKQPSDFDFCNQACINGTVRILDVSLVHTPEPTSVLSLFALGTLGGALTLKRQIKPSKSSEKETTKVG